MMDKRLNNISAAQSIFLQIDKGLREKGIKGLATDKRIQRGSWFRAEVKAFIKTGRKKKINSIVGNLDGKIKIDKPGCQEPNSFLHLILSIKTFCHSLESQTWGEEELFRVDFKKDSFIFFYKDPINFWIAASLDRNRGKDEKINVVSLYKKVAYENIGLSFSDLAFPIINLSEGLQAPPHRMMEFKGGQLAFFWSNQLFSANASIQEIFQGKQNKNQPPNLLPNFASLLAYLKETV